MLRVLIKKLLISLLLCLTSLIIWRQIVFQVREASQCLDRWFGKISNGMRVGGSFKCMICQKSTLLIFTLYWGYIWLKTVPKIYYFFLLVCHWLGIFNGQRLFGTTHSHYSGREKQGRGDLVGCSWNKFFHYWCKTRIHAPCQSHQEWDFCLSRSPANLPKKTEAGEM